MPSLTISEDNNDNDINGDSNQGELGISLCVWLVLDRENSFMPNEVSPRSHTRLKSHRPWLRAESQSWTVSLARHSVWPCCVSFREAPLTSFAFSLTSEMSGSSRRIRYSNNSPTLSPSLKPASQGLLCQGVPVPCISHPSATSHCLGSPTP